MADAAENHLAGRDFIETLRKGFPVSCAFRMSGKPEKESQMRFHRDSVPMGLPGLDERHIQATSENAVRTACRILKDP